MKIGTKIIAYYLPSSEHEQNWPPKIINPLSGTPLDAKNPPMHGVVVDKNDPTFEEVERVDMGDQEILVRFPCEKHPRGKTCNCFNNIRSMGRIYEHLYEESYYGGYYGQVVIVEEK